MNFCSSFQAELINQKGMAGYNVHLQCCMQYYH